MTKGLITPADSTGIIEVSGAISLAKLLQSLRTDTRARMIGATQPNAAGVITVVIAGGLAEVQHAVDLVKSAKGVSEIAFFARPDMDAMKLLLKTLNLAEEKPERETKTSHVRSVAELDVTEMETWNVHELRRYARSIPSFPLHGREISKANRPELIRLLTPIVYSSNSPRAYPAKDMLPS
jgi:microcompartment protein CcmL/EutN